MGLLLLLLLLLLLSLLLLLLLLNGAKDSLGRPFILNVKFWRKKISFQAACFSWSAEKSIWVLGFQI